jgi:hypothetical protein
MWSFRRQKQWHQLGDDVPSIINELFNRNHWKSLPQALIGRFAVNSTYVFERPIEAADALKRLVFILESECFRGRLQQIANASDWSYEVCVLCSHLEQFASQSEGSGALAVADSAATSILVCERYALTSYVKLARLSLTVGQNKEEAALWCDRYRRAERDLLAEDASHLSIHARAVRECLDLEKARQTAEEMRRVLPKHLLDKHLPDFDSADCLTPREMVEQIEAMIRNNEEQRVRDAPAEFKSLYSDWATHSHEFKQFLRGAPAQFEVLYALWAMCSDALCYRADEVYRSTGHARPRGPCLFEVQLSLLASIVDLMDSFEQNEEAIERFIHFACHGVAVDLHPRLLTNTDLHEIALSRLREYWELRSSSGNWGELHIKRLKQL